VGCCVSLVAILCSGQLYGDLRLGLWGSGKPEVAGFAKEGLCVLLKSCLNLQNPNIN
jgi:hypothetical protein